MKKKFNRDYIYFIIGFIFIAGTFLLAFYPRKPDVHSNSGIEQLAVLEDKTLKLTLSDVLLLSDDFVLQKYPRMFEQLSSSAYWMRFKISSNNLDGLSYLELDAPSCENITIYFPDTDPLTLGKKIKLNDLLLKTRIPTALIPNNITPEDYIYIRVHTSTIYNIPLEITKSEKFVFKISKENFIFGFFFGALLAVLVINLFGLIIVKNRIFLLYLMYLISLIVYHFRVHGLSYFLNLSFDTNERMLWLSLAGVGIFMILFAQAFLHLKEKFPLINRILDLFIVFFIIQTVFGVLLFSHLANKIAYITGSVVPVIIIIVTIVDYQNGNKDVRFYLLAWAALFTATLIWSTAAYIDSENLINYIFLGGSTLDTLLFTLAIFDKIKKDLHLKEILEAREKYYLEIVRTDPLTGLYNRRFLENQIEKIYSEEDVFSNNSVLIIDLDNFRKINEQYGHLSGDQILIKVGTRILKKIRKTDIACRYGGDEFIVFLYDTPIETATDIAQKISDDISQNRIALETGKSIFITVSIGISECRDDDSFEGLFLRADAALFQAKKIGPNEISTL